MNGGRSRRRRVTASRIPVDDGAHVEADVLKGSNVTLLHSAEVGQVVVYVDHLHAALKGALDRSGVGVQEVAWRQEEQVTTTRSFVTAR